MAKLEDYIARLAGDETRVYDYLHRELGYTEMQSYVFARLYGGECREIPDAIKAYMGSKDYYNGLSFFASLQAFLEAGGAERGIEPEDEAAETDADLPDDAASPDREFGSLLAAYAREHAGAFVFNEDTFLSVIRQSSKIRYEDGFGRGSSPSAGRTLAAGAQAQGSAQYLGSASNSHAPLKAGSGEGEESEGGAAESKPPLFSGLKQAVGRVFSAAKASLPSGALESDAYYEDDEETTIAYYEDVDSYEEDEDELVFAGSGSPRTGNSSFDLHALLSRSSMSMAAGVPAGAAGQDMGGGSGSLPGSEGLQDKLRYDRYENINEKGFRQTAFSPTSTFRMTCSRASFDILRNNLRRHPGQKIDPSMVRLEEMLNYFDYQIPVSPQKNSGFSIYTELCDKPGDASRGEESTQGHKLLFVSVDNHDAALPCRQNYVILMDVSGSMEDNYGNSILSVLSILSKLREGDAVSLLAYSETDSTVFQNIRYRQGLLEEMLQRILLVHISGCTNGSKGLESAYSLIASNFDAAASNRVFLITDGDFNFGDNSISSLQRQIGEKKKTGAFLSVIGMGIYNLNDEIMQTLAKNGNGCYTVVNSLSDVEENIHKNFPLLSRTAATDVKAQVEFNPKFVKAYRLLGYENRELSHEEFRNDKVVSEPFACGDHGVALYELEMLPQGEGGVSGESGLRYQSMVLKDSDELCTVSVRYKDLQGVAHEISENVPSAPSARHQNARLAFAVMVAGGRLRQSEYVSQQDSAYVEKLLQQEDFRRSAGAKVELLESFLQAPASDES